MKSLLRIEELVQWMASAVLFHTMVAPWWLYISLILTPDISMLGYLAGPKIGAWIYNFFHHKAVAGVVCSAGFMLQNDVITGAGLILFGHTCMDRVFGYGLKFTDDFKHTHLGWIGKRN